MKKFAFLFFIIFLEGYVVLSSELLAMRLIIPFVGSGTDTVSIIIAAVLMPLAVGYYAGGQYKERHKNNHKRTIRKKLVKNIFIAMLFFSLGLSYIFVEFFFDKLNTIGVENRLIATTIYSLIFLVYPVFLLAQTIPLVSFFFSKEKLSEITGKMLAFSTIGSFMGAVFSTLVLMAFIGVHYTVITTLLCLVILFFCLSKKKVTIPAFIMVAIFVAAAIGNSGWMMAKKDIVANNKYNTIRVYDNKSGNARILSMNNNLSSRIGKDQINQPRSFKYIEFMERTILDRIKTDGKVQDILVIGAGGFTLGFDDFENDYIFVDIDGDLKNIAEDEFLMEDLGENKKFQGVPARSYLNDAIKEGKKFDVVVLDAYQGATTIPEHLVTVEFFDSLKKVLKDEAVVAANFIGQPTFSSHLMINLHNSFTAVFPHTVTQLLRMPNFWSTEPEDTRNMIYVYKHGKNTDGTIYTDDKNRVYYDKHLRAFDKKKEE